MNKLRTTWNPGTVSTVAIILIMGMLFLLIYAMRDSGTVQYQQTILAQQAIIKNLSAENNAKAVTIDQLETMEKFFTEGSRKEIDTKIVLYQLDPKRNMIFIIGQMPGEHGRDQFVAYWYQFSDGDCSAEQLDQTLVSAQEAGAFVTISYSEFVNPNLSIYEGKGSPGQRILWSANECHDLAE